MKLLLKPLIVVLLLLLIPFIAMQFTNQVNWDLLDFTVAFVLLYVGILALMYVWKKNQNFKIKLLWGGLIVFVFLLLWAELAVGIFS